MNQARDPYNLDKELHVMLRFSDVFVEWSEEDMEPKSYGVTTIDESMFIDLLFRSYDLVDGKPQHGSC